MLDAILSNVPKMREKIKLDFLDTCFSLVQEGFDGALKILATLLNIERFRTQIIKKPIYLETIFLMFELELDKIAYQDVIIFFFHLV